jgi:hypothetical protein
MMVLVTLLTFLALFSLLSMFADSEDPRRGADPRDPLWIRFGQH